MAIALESDLVSRMNRDHSSQVQRIRHALGAVAAREPAVFWLYEDRDGGWCVRREGDEGEKRFGDSEKAREFLGLDARVPAGGIGLSDHGDTHTLCGGLAQWAQRRAARPIGRKGLGLYGFRAS